jgi:Mg-chelatase subunit ChlD
VDVVLVIDTSNSMLELSGGRTKLAAATEAAGSFLQLLALDPAAEESDAAAIVAFNDGATALSDLERDRATLEGALAVMPQGPGTRIDLGLLEADRLLSGPRRAATHLPVVVLLTDGLPSAGATPQSVRDAADVLRSHGVLIFAVGLGPDVDPTLLGDVAGAPDRLVLAPDAADLKRIYADIARELPCVVGP